MSETDKKPETLEDAVKIIEELTAQANDADKWKALSRKNEDRAKENAEAAKKADELQKRLDEIEASKLTEGEKNARKLTELEASLKAEQDARKASDMAALRARIGAEKGLDPRLIKVLQGDDETSIAAHADELAEIATTEAGTFDIGQGARGSAKGAATDPLLQTLAAKVGAQL